MAAGLINISVTVFGFSNQSGPAPGSVGAGLIDITVDVQGVGTHPTRGAGLIDVGVQVKGFGEVVFARQSENPKTYLFRTIDRKSGANGIEEFEFVREDLSIYPGSNQAPNLSGGSLGGSPAPPVIEDPNADNSRPGSTQIVFLDIPQLLGEHDGPGFIVAATGLSDGWVGALLFEKKGSEFVQIAEMGQRAAIGRADTKLNSGDVTLFDASGRTYVFDDTNTVDVTLKDGVSTLVSVSDADLFAGVNAAAIGIHGRWEIILFGTATQLSERKWRLSHLLRGMKGTEWAVNTHKAGDTFVLLNESIRRVRDSYTELDVARTFRAVSVGDSVDNTSNRSFTNSGVSLKPLAPVFLRGEEDAAENRTLRWYRRSRLNGLAGRDTYDPAPLLGESIERYETDILNGAGTSVLRTLTSSIEAVHYTAAQQVTDFGAVPVSLNIVVYQISETRGRGYGAAATIGTFDSPEPIPPPGTGTGVAIYVLKTMVPGKPRAGFPIMIDPISPEVVTFPEDFAASRAVLLTAATAESIYSVQKNGVEFGTFTFASAADEATFASSGDMVFDPSVDVLTIIPPAQDATASGLGVSIVGVREGVTVGFGGSTSTAVISPKHAHDSGAGPPAAGSVEKVGHLYVDTVNSRIYFGVVIAGNFIDFGSLGDSFNQFTDGANAVSASGSTTFKFEAGPNISGLISSGPPAKIVFKIELAGETPGDILYRDGSNWVRLPKGTDGQVLTLVGGLPAWV